MRLRQLGSFAFYVYMGYGHGFKNELALAPFGYLVHGQVRETAGLCGAIGLVGC